MLIKDKNCEVLTDSQGINFIFSGKCILKNFKGFVYGINDIKRNIANFNVYDLKKAIGNFSVLVFLDDHIECFSDFYGIGKTFYSSKQNMEVISNSYHLILTLIKLKGCTLNFDVNKILSGLLSIKSQIFQSNYSNKMDYKDVFQKLPFENILIDKNIKISNNYMFDILNNKMICNHNSKVVETKIKETLNHILNDERFDNVIFDLTGGLDSRVLFACISTMESEQKKLLINSNKKNTNDYLIASNLNQMYNYKSGVVNVKRTNFDFDSIDTIQRSYYLGTYYAHGLLKYKEFSCCAHVNGGLGEVNFRPLYGRNLYRKDFYKYYENSKYKELLHHYMSSYAPSFIIDSDNLVEEYVCNVYKITNLFPLQNNYQKFDLHYLFMRNAYHFDPYISDSFNCVAFSPLESVESFQLLHKSMSNECSINYQLSTIYDINPYLLNYSFEDVNDSVDFDCFKNKVSSLKNFKNFELNSKLNMEIEIKKKIEVTNSNVHILNEKDCFFYRILFICEYLFKMNIITNSNRLSLYYFAKNNKNNKYLRQLYNYLISVYDQLEIFNQKG